MLFAGLDSLRFELEPKRIRVSLDSHLDMYLPVLARPAMAGGGVS